VLSSGVSQTPLDEAAADVQDAIRFSRTSRVSRLTGTG